MRIGSPAKPRLIGVFLLVMVVTGCGSFSAAGRTDQPAMDADQVLTALTPDIEALYLAWRELDQIYKDIKSLERGLLFDPDDRQLGIIQQASLYLQDAALRIQHAWERLSVLHYIRPDMLRDYLILNVDGLMSAIDASTYDNWFLTIYRSFVENTVLAAELERSQRSLQTQVALMHRIADKLQTMTQAETEAMRL